MPEQTESLATQELTLKIEKLRVEIVQLQRGQTTIARLKDWLPILTAAIPALALMFALLQFTTQQRAQHADLKRRALADSVASEREFMVPILERQMALYMEAINAAATIAGSKDETERRKAADKFWTLYWGPLAMFESKAVSAAMMAFGNCISDPKPACNAGELRNKSLELASALQEDYFASWSLTPMAYAERSTNYLKLHGRQ